MRISREIKDAQLAAWLQSAPEHELARVYQEQTAQELTITEMNAKGGAFSHLADEPDLYSDEDVTEKNEAFVR